MKNIAKWSLEIFRIAIVVASVVVSITIYGAKLSTQIALNTQSINNSNAIATNHLDHLEDDIAEIKESLKEINEYILNNK